MLSTFTGNVKGGMIAGLLSLALVGCSSNDVADPYKGDLLDAQRRATSEFEKSVLDDLQITRAEYEEAIQRYVSCVKDRNLDISVVEQHGYYTYRVTGVARDSDGGTAVADTVLQECRIGSIDLIESIYVTKLQNPLKIDIESVTADCIKRERLVTGDYSGEDYLRDAKNNFAGSGFDPDDPRLTKCLANPSS